MLGEFTGSLSNGGERLRLTLADGGDVADFTYDDAPPWPTAPDGGGPSLERSEPAAFDDPSAASGWRASVAPAGSPGTLP